MFVIKQYEMSLLTLWANRLSVRVRLRLDDSDGKTANYRTGTYTSKAGAVVGFVDLSAECMLILKYMPAKTDTRSAFGEVAIPSRRYADFKRVLNEIYDVVYNEVTPCFVKYPDGTMVLTPKAEAMEWYVTDLPMQRVLRIILAVGADENGNAASMPGVIMQIQNRNSSALLSWNDFYALHHLINNLSLEQMTPLIMNLLYYENLLTYFSRRAPS